MVSQTGGRLAGEGLASFAWHPRVRNTQPLRGPCWPERPAECGGGLDCSGWGIKGKMEVRGKGSPWWEGRRRQEEEGLGEEASKKCQRWGRLRDLKAMHTQG